jgi:hypothetical protein
MNDQNEILEQETEEVETEIDTDEESGDDFNYDEDGNIIVDEDDTDTEEDAEASEDADEDSAEDTDDGENDDDDDHDDGDTEIETKGTPETDTQSKTDKERYNELAERVKDMLEKLGEKDVTDGNLLDKMIKLAAEATDMTFDEYKKMLEDQAKEKKAQVDAVNARFEAVAAADLSALKAIYPELKDIKHISELPNWEDFGRLRDIGVSLSVAYKMVKTESVNTTATQQPHKKTLEGTKDHLKSVTGKSAQGGSAMPKAKLSEWRQMFPHKSDKEIEKLYKSTM